MKKGQIVAMAVMGIMTVACTDYDLNGQTGWQGNELLELSASISETVPTRAEGEPAKGTYYFSYIKSNENSYQTLEVDFKEGKDTLTEPTWKDINTNDITNKLFILDNVPYINEYGFTSSNDDKNKLIDLQNITEGTDNSESRYNAGPAPAVPGEGNDLLWDTVKVEKVSVAPLSPVHFDLEHRMSMLTFKLQSKDPGINTLLNDKKNVEVKLHRVITEPYQFNRLTGAITINSSTKPIEENNAVILVVAEEYTPDKGAITQSWIFPPQEFHKTERPVLAITLTDTENNQTRTFKGVLPESMLYEGKYKPLEFLSGCHLTVTVVLGNWDDLAINFRPVLVKKWVTYSAKDINAKQVGVYTAEELTELVNAYNENSSENNLALWKYGVYNDNNGSGTWTFDLWKSITGITDEEIIKDGKLNFVSTNGTSFTFNSHGHTINGSGVDKKGQLKVGVVKNEDLTALVQAYNQQNEETLKKYGTYDETSKTWTFYLWTNLTGVTGYEGKDNLGFTPNSGFTFISNGYTINGMHVNTDGSFVGVFNNNDLTALVSAYNANPEDNETLQNYGTYDEDNSTWTFYLWTNLTEVTGLNEDLGFTPNSGFTFISNGHTINGMHVNTDGSFVGVFDNEDLTNLVNAYNASSQNKETLQNYGTYDEDNSTWTFYLWKDQENFTSSTGENNLGFKDKEPRFTFISNGHTINGMHVNTDGSFVGVFDNDDLTALVEAYNQDSQDEEILQKYGTYNGSTWTFYLWTNLTVDTITDNLGFNSDKTPGFTFKANGHTINGKTVETNGTLTDNSTTDGGE